MLTPSYKLTIGKKVVDTTDEPQASTAVDLTVALDLDTPADAFTLMLGNVGSFRPARDDEATIELGYADNGGLTQVITGKVVTVEPNLTTTRVAGYSEADALSRTFVEQTYESKTAGEIVRDLADRAGLKVATAEDGIKFPAYVVDGRRSAYIHMHDLAELCGFDLYVDAEGELVFEKFVSGKTVHVFEFGKHIVALEVSRNPALTGFLAAWFPRKNPNYQTKLQKLSNPEANLYKRRPIILSGRHQMSRVKAGCETGASPWQIISCRWDAR